MAKKRDRRNRSRSQEPEAQAGSAAASTRRVGLRLEWAAVAVALIVGILAVPPVQQFLSRIFGLSRPDISLVDVAFCEKNAAAAPGTGASPSRAVPEPPSPPCDGPDIQNLPHPGPFLVLKINNRTDQNEYIQELKVALDELGVCGTKGATPFDSGPLPPAISISAKELPRERTKYPVEMSLKVPDLMVHPKESKWYPVPLRLDSSGTSKGAIRARGRFTIVSTAGKDANPKSIAFGIPTIPDVDCDILIQAGH